MIKKRIVAIVKRGLTTRGNPKDYWFILECGHISLRSHCPDSVISEFSLLYGLEPKRRCKDCEEGRPVDVDLLGKLTPYKVWNKENFDRFVKKKTRDKI